MSHFIANLTPSQWLVVLGLVAVLAFGTLLAVRDCLYRDFDSPGEKAAWIQLSIFIPFLGVIAYLLIGKKRGRKL